MQQLLGGKAPFNSLLLRELLLQRLPSNVQMILALADEMSIDKLAKMTDRIIDVATPIVTAVNASTGGNSIHKMISEEINVALQTQERSCP